MKKGAKKEKADGAIRFAPTRDGKLAAHVWKVWSEGSEVYALIRSSRGVAKLSIHESGQIHFRLESKETSLLAPPISFASGRWLHAIELRFLLHAQANSPPERPEAGVVLLETPLDQMLIVNILVGAAGCSADETVPDDFCGASILWRSTLRNGRPAVLIARHFATDERNSVALKEVWEEVSPKINFEQRPENFYMEVVHAHWHEHNGNVILVIPMGVRHARFPGDRLPSAMALAVPQLTLQLASPEASTLILAPNGAIVATLTIRGVVSTLVLKRDEYLTARLAVVTLTIRPENLIAGSAFVARPIRLSCIPTVNGARPREWSYTIVSRFDGDRLVAEVRCVSGALRTGQLIGELTGLEETDEIVITAPSTLLRLSACSSNPIALSALNACLLLRES